MAIGSQFSTSDQPFTEMNTTPLIDVMLVLLMMFMITLPAALQSTSPQIGIGGSHPDRERIRLSIDFDGTLIWNGEALHGFSDLQALLSNVAGRLPQLDVYADKRARCDTVAKALALAQRSGVKDIGIAGT